MKSDIFNFLLSDLVHESDFKNAYLINIKTVFNT